MSDAFDPVRARADEVVGRSVVEALKRRGFDAVYAATKEDALRRILDLIPEGATVGVPGTVTVRELGAMEALAERGHTVYQHWGADQTAEDKEQARRDENAADCFLTSANAITRDGEIISIDGAGNRVAGMAWGRGKLIFVVSLDKLASDLMEGIRRARTATIPNALRLGAETACTKAGRCVDCRSESRMCRAVLILEGPSMGREVHVILVGEPLGY